MLWFCPEHSGGGLCTVYTVIRRGGRFQGGGEERQVNSLLLLSLGLFWFLRDRFGVGRSV